MANNGGDDWKDSLYSSSAQDTYLNSFVSSVVDLADRRRREVPEDSREPFTRGRCCTEVDSDGSDSDSEGSEPESQMDTCTRLALEQLGISLEDVEGVDTNGFDLEQFRENDGMMYFHTVFMGRKPGEAEPTYYFTELSGVNGPEDVTTVVEIYEGDWTTENCVFCGGIWHPCDGGFKGHIKGRR